MTNHADCVAAFDANDKRPLTRVAVAIIERINTETNQYEVLFAQRPEGKAYAGYWELPGGKIEAEETVLQALIREIDEELGIQIEAATEWLVERFSYPHAHVELHFCRAPQWRGEPVGREAQAFSWQAPVAIQVSPLLPALLTEERRVLRGLIALSAAR
jgi:8-oxo-dGTP diphosphatase